METKRKKLKTEVLADHCDTVDKVTPCDTGQGPVITSGSTFGVYILWVGYMNKDMYLTFSILLTG